jgi:hypothetical protein
MTIARSKNETYLDLINLSITEVFLGFRIKCRIERAKILPIYRVFDNVIAPFTILITLAEARDAYQNRL